MAADPAPAAPNYFRLRPVWDWARGNIPAALSLIGILIYGIVRVSSWIFYYRLDLRPENVGLGYAQTIPSAAYLLTSLLIGSWLLRAIVVAPLNWIGLHTPPGSYLHERALEDRTLQGDFKLQMIFVPVLIAFVIWFPFVAYQEASEILHGRLPHGTFVSAMTNFYAIEGNGAHLEQILWTIPVPSPTLPMSGQCVLYLGSSDGLTALYVPSSRRTIRVSSGQIVLTTSPAFNHLRRCP